MDYGRRTAAKIDDIIRRMAKRQALYTFSEAAKALRMTRSQFYRLRKKHEIPVVPIAKPAGPQDYRIHPRVVLELRAKHGTDG
jgi:predicted DNA-binding transcriptional regulator AlpA